MKTKYPYKQDDELLCEAGNLIDNAVWAFYLSAMAEEADKETFDAAVHALMEDPDNGPAITNDLFEKAVEIARSPDMQEERSFPPTDGEEPEWDMGIIGNMTDALEGLMAKAGFQTCHPWQDDEECICYCTEERCAYCRKEA